MRFPLATDLKTRTGAPSTKDARLLNCYPEIKGGQSAVRKRPGVQYGPIVSSGQSQGGFGFNYGGTDYILNVMGDQVNGTALSTASPFTITFWASSYAYASAYSSTATYSIGSPVIYTDPTTGTPGLWYSLSDNNTGTNPTNDPNLWSQTAPGTHRYYATSSGYDGGTAKVGESCSNQLAALQSVFNKLTYTSCPGNPAAGYIWLEGPLGYVSGTSGTAYNWYTTSHDANCANAANAGQVGFGTITQTA